MPGVDLLVESLLLGLAPGLCLGLLLEKISMSLRCGALVVIEGSLPISFSRERNPDRDTLTVRVWSVVDRNRVADEMTDFAPSPTSAIQKGPCVSPGGSLSIAARNRVLSFSAAGLRFEKPDAL